MSTESLENVFRRINKILSVCGISTDDHIRSPHADLSDLSVFSEGCVLYEIDNATDSILHFFGVIRVVSSESPRIGVHFLTNYGEVLLVLFDADVGPDR